ncbi:MAG: TlpA family protein disulfide reductase [Bacteroidales bacterium]|nr:TlpA family protein disulfide reductase [Candidatus Physcousia equi]
MKKTTCCIALLACLAMSSCKKEAQAAEGTEVNTEVTAESTTEENSVTQKLAGVELTDPEGKTITLASLRGSYLYIDIWASWCKPCCMEIPYLEKLVASMADQEKVRFLSISIDHQPEAWHAKLAEEKPSWPQYLVNSTTTDLISETLNFKSIPRFVIIDPEGNVVNDDAKRPSDETLEADLRAL